MNKKQLNATESLLDVKSEQSVDFVLSKETPLLHPLLDYWILKILCSLDAHRRFISKDSIDLHDLGMALGLEKWINTEENFDRSAILKLLNQRFLAYSDQDLETIRLSYSSYLNNNLQKLANLVNLSEIDVKILHFRTIMQLEPLLDDVADLLGALSSLRVIHFVAKLLDIEEKQLRVALSEQSTLHKTGLLCLDRSGTMYLRSKLDLISDNFEDLVISDDIDPYMLLQEVVQQSPKSELTVANYPHISAHLEIAIPYLKQAIESNKSGVNILIYGNAGTGKTELSRVLADTINVRLFEVSSEDENHNPIKGERRLRAYQAAQNFFSNQKILLMFDELEDMFKDDTSMNPFANSPKAWLNRTLENNTAPAIWLCNYIGILEDAFIRRFDIIIELESPPQRIREDILMHAYDGLLAQSTVKALSKSKFIVPAIITRSAKVIQEVAPQLTDLNLSAKTLINSTLKAQQHPQVAVQLFDQLVDIYSPDFVNADLDLNKICTSLQTNKDARLCFYGPSGTGKTEYAKYIADTLEMPLLIKKASDLLSKYIGENEQNIAQSFEEANQTASILLIDEVDSFLSDRRFAKNSWETTMVNELLVQIESYQGILIATTNLMHKLDPAVMRRFDFKIKFDYLKPEQAEALLVAQCRLLDYAVPNQEDLARLHHIRTITPGDFAITMRQARMKFINTVDEIITQLENDNKLKEVKPSVMGFLSADSP